LASYVQRILLIWIAFATLKFRDILHLCLRIIKGEPCFDICSEFRKCQKKIRASPRD
jgi:hypothetical protein